MRLSVTLSLVGLGTLILIISSIGIGSGIGDISGPPTHVSGIEQKGTGCAQAEYNPIEVTRQGYSFFVRSPEEKRNVASGTPEINVTVYNNRTNGTPVNGSIRVSVSNQAAKPKIIAQQPPKQAKPQKSAYQDFRKFSVRPEDSPDYWTIKFPEKYGKRIEAKIEMFADGGPYKRTFTLCFYGDTTISQRGEIVRFLLIGVIAVFGLIQGYIFRNDDSEWGDLISTVIIVLIYPLILDIGSVSELRTIVWAVVVFIMFFIIGWKART
jgi:hypothetical protein